MSNARRRKFFDGGSLLKVALSYASEGIAVFPLHGIVDGQCTCGKENCDNAGKHPIPRSGFKDATTNADRIESWWKKHPDANLGAVPGPTFLVLDVDPRNGGFDSLADLERDHGALPGTAVAETGEYEVGGQRVRGLHIWLRVPDGTPLPRKKEIAEGIEVKGDRGYVVMPPSMHASRVRYRWRD